jgi:hypothetical protein
MNRALVRARIDTAQTIDLEQGDFGRIDTSIAQCGIAVALQFDYSGAELHLAFGVAGTRMPMSVMKRLWPMFIAADCAHGWKTIFRGHG